MEKYNYEDQPEMEPTEGKVVVQVLDLGDNNQITINGDINTIGSTMVSLLVDIANNVDKDIGNNEGIKLINEIHKIAVEALLDGETKDEEVKGE